MKYPPQERIQSNIILVYPDSLRKRKYLDILQNPFERIPVVGTPLFPLNHTRMFPQMRRSLFAVDFPLSELLHHLRMFMAFGRS